MSKLPIFEHFLSVENLKPKLKWFFKPKLKPIFFLLNWVPGVLDSHVLVQQRFRRGREGADLTLEALGGHHVYVTGENARVAVRVCDVLEEVLLGVGLERASQALVLHAGDAPLQVHPLDSLPLSQRSRFFAQ